MRFEMSKIRAIFFDLDNTLVDFTQMKRESCRAAVQEMISFGLKMNANEAYALLMQTYSKLGLESDIAFTQFLKDNNQFDHKILAAAINKYLETKRNFVKPYPKVKPTLQELKTRRLMMSIVTDAPKTKAYQRLIHMGIDEYFHFVVGFEDTESEKREGLPMKFAIKKLDEEFPNLPNSEVLMVGDSMARDVNPAKQLGLRTALAKYGQQLQEETGTPDYVLNEFSDILKII